MGTMNFMAQAVGPSTTYGANLQFRRQVELLVVIPPKQMLQIDARWPIARWRSCTNNRVENYVLQIKRIFYNEQKKGILTVANQKETM